jgi:hypothetical protein
MYHTFKGDAGMLGDTNAVAHQAQRPKATSVAARDELTLPDVVQVHHCKVKNWSQVRELLQYLRQPAWMLLCRALTLGNRIPEKPCNSDLLWRNTAAYGYSPPRQRAAAAKFDECLVYTEMFF